MHLAIPLTLLTGHFVAAAPSIQHAQISVETTNLDGQDQLDSLHSSEELVMNRTNQDDDDLLENLAFNFTLGVQYVNRGQDGGQGEGLHFGFDDSKADSFVRGELGFATEFAFLDGKLINGNKALGEHPHPIRPGWTSLRALKGDTPSSIFDLLVYSTGSGERQRYVIKFANSDESFGALSIKPGEPVLWGTWDEIDRPNQLRLTVERVRNFSDEIIEDSAEELL